LERRVRFDLFGQEFSFYTDASEDEVEQVIGMVRAELDDQCRGKCTSLLSNKMLVLCCLKIAARYVQLEKEHNRFRDRQDESIDKLISKVSSGIDSENL
jgi:cell division protein ZapA